jgi:hypothetical protein
MNDDRRTRALRRAGRFGAAVVLLCACAHDRVDPEPPLASFTAPARDESSLTPVAMPQPVPMPPGMAGLPQAGAPATGVQAPASTEVQVPSAAASPNPDCDLSGRWIAQHVTRNSALGAVQAATSWHLHLVVQRGERFVVTQSMDCGFAVRGTTDVSLPDATLEAVAVRSLDATGVSGSYAPSADGQSCAFEFDRSYSLRGADRTRFIDPVWKVGDPPKALSEFKLPTNAADGMEDWDQDGHEGITQTTGFGDRYSVQLDWYALHGQTPLRARQFGGEGSVAVDYVAVDYDERESISSETSALLQNVGTPMSPGYASLVRVDGELDVVETGEHPRLQTCKNVQALAVAKFGNPASP